MLYLKNERISVACRNVAKSTPDRISLILVQLPHSRGKNTETLTVGHNATWNFFKYVSVATV